MSTRGAIARQKADGLSPESKGGGTTMHQFIINQRRYRSNDSMVEMQVSVPMLSGDEKRDLFLRGWDYQEWFPLWFFEPLSSHSPSTLIASLSANRGL